MYKVDDVPISEIFLIYLAVIGACIVLIPLSKLLVTAITRGVQKWG